VARAHLFLERLSTLYRRVLVRLAGIASDAEEAAAASSVAD